MTTFDQATRAALATWANEEGQADESVLASGVERFDLGELLKLEADATPGPWRHFWDSVWSGVDFQNGKWRETDRTRCFGSINTKEDRAFIAAARNAIPLLPAYIARQRAEARREALAAVQSLDLSLYEHSDWGSGYDEGLSRMKEAAMEAIRVLLTEPTP